MKVNSVSNVYFQSVTNKKNDGYKANADKQQIAEISHITPVTPDFKVKLPAKYNKLGVYKMLRKKISQIQGKNFFQRIIFQ